MIIKIYTETNNPFCGMAKQWLDINKYTYEEVCINDPHEIQGFYESLEKSVDTLPQIFIDGKHIGGFDSLLRTDLV